MENHIYTCCPGGTGARSISKSKYYENMTRVLINEIMYNKCTRTPEELASILFAHLVAPSFAN